ncbi:hypothetical protein HMPREF0602_2076 [Neisseria meningitidis ATCC 13091]|uniref:Uncharacterized protein n=1 Tax=Neisseria meningitidis serogroup B (strain ATCC 13091 / M2091) TaxID=862513 RepID=E0NC44_NEIM3|nr:hypothetical protein HMPREF0602_2076 [Neisseria meningitidis ATCC 13091]
MLYYLYCLRLRRLVLIFVNPLYFGWKPVLKNNVDNFVDNFQGMAKCRLKC